MKHIEWLKNPTRFLAMTGQTIENYNYLLEPFREIHDEYFSEYDYQGKLRPYRIKAKIYTNSGLNSHEERLVFLLSYLKLNNIQECHADLFNIDQRQCNMFIHSLKEVLDKTLLHLNVMPSETDAHLQLQLATLSEKEIIHDGIEREIPRPQDKDVQKSTYSGKAHKNTLKNGIITTMSCFVLFLSPSVEGKMHDKKLADTYYSIPPNFTLWQDTGYQGYCPDNVTIMQPIKKKAKTELSQIQKDYNTSISRIRVRVEHAIGSIKRCRIVKDECRCRKRGFPYTILRTCAGLHNFRITKNKFQYTAYKQITKLE
jgi:DDE superfamily endonuclease